MPHSLPHSGYQPFRTARLFPTTKARAHVVPKASPPKRRAMAIGGLGILSLLFSSSFLQAQNPSEDGKILSAFENGDYSRVIALTEKTHASSSTAHQARSAAFERRGEQNFFAGQITEAIADFDQYIALNPDREPHHWQRGIAYYYANSYKKGKAQFTIHQTVNSQDVENAVWHFICAVRSPGGSVEEARKHFIPIERDQRVPMKEVHALFAGTGSPEAVIAAAQAGNPSPENLRNQLCYAHLYLGLYYEALGQGEESAKHIQLAAEDYKMDHYMGRVAQVHAKLRKIPPKS